MKKALFISILVLGFCLALAAKTNQEAYNDIRSNLATILSANNNDGLQQSKASKEYAMNLRQLFESKDEALLKKVLEECWLPVTNAQAETTNIKGYEISTLFKIATDRLIISCYKNNLEEGFGYLEKFVFAPSFFDLGKRSIVNDIGRPGKLSFEYVYNFTYRALKCKELPEQTLLLALNNLDMVEFENNIRKCDFAPGFKELLFSFGQKPTSDVNMRTKCIGLLARSDSKDKAYKQRLIDLMNESDEFFAHFVLRMLSYYHDYKYTQMLIDSLYSRLEIEPGNYEELSETIGGGNSPDLSSIATAGTANSVELITDLIRHNLGKDEGQLSSLVKQNFLLNL